jgi:alkylated DNA nucleotide flippase Atl1
MFRIHSLFIKTRVGAPMRRVQSLEAIAGYGLAGDCNAHAASPRQVLLVDLGTIAEMILAEDDLRANLVIDGDLERVASGRSISFGQVRLRITIPCEPCGKLNVVRPRLSREIGLRRGLLARVLSGGTLQVGDIGATDAWSTPPLASDWKARVRHIVMQVPEGKVITYSALVTAAGVQSAYCRALPSVLKVLGRLDVPVHRVVPSDPRKIDADNLRKLRKEGANLTAGKTAHWNNVLYFATQESPKVRFKVS